ncbi:MAG: YcaO-like family protein [Actinomycetota bacterium]|nr:YcaO-like family protein [Actinomycetota bacterium]
MTGAPQLDIYGAGAHPNSAVSQIVSIAEGVERAACGKLRWDKVCGARALDTQCLDVRKSHLLSRTYIEQNPQLRAFSEEMPIEWIMGRRLATGIDCAVPVDVVFYPLSMEQLGRLRIAYSNSSGVAAGSSSHQAQASAILELIERDALMRLWLGEYSPVPIQSDAMDIDILEAHERWQRAGRSLRMWRLRADVPTVLAILSGDSPPAFVCGAASYLSLLGAMKRALNELEASAVGVTGYAMVPPMPVGSIKSPQDHAAYYVDCSNARLLEAIFANTHKPQVTDCEQSSANSVDELIARYSPIEIELTPDAGPLKIVRVIIESLVLIWFGVAGQHARHVRVQILQAEVHRSSVIQSPFFP